MASSTLVSQFVKYLSSDDCASNIVWVPRKFTLYNEDVLDENLLLTIRNGYKLVVSYDSTNRTFVGMRDFYADFGLTGGELLIFEYVGNSIFKIYVVGRDGVEISYPSKVHASQSSVPLTVEAATSGWRFVKYFSYGQSNLDEIVLPTSFLVQFEGLIPSVVKYVLKNGAEYYGYHDDMNQKLTGLSRVCPGLGLFNFNSFDMLVLIYDIGEKLKLAFFDGRNVEILLDNETLASGNLCFSLHYPSHFATEIMSFHMLRYVHGVDISAQFFRVFDFWKKKDVITVYEGPRSWLLEVRKRRTGHRTTINAGWIQFCDDLQLNVSDRCWFKWIDESYHRFRVEVVRGVIEID